jgi:hypothetical protein
MAAAPSRLILTLKATTENKNVKHMSFVLLLLFVVISTLCMTHAIRTLRVSPHVIRRTDAKSSTAVDLSNSSYNQTTQSGDIEVVADGVVNAHVVMVSFGDSPRPARLLIDTGSPDTLVMVANVDLARLQESSITPTSFADFLPFIGPILFDLRLSATGRNLSYDNVAAMNAHWCANEQLKFEMGSNPCTIGEIYGDGSLRLGAVERDVVDLGARADMVFLRALRVGSGHLSAKTDNAIEGILGLSPSDGIGHLPATLDQLKRRRRDLKHRVFGLCLPDPASPFDAFDSADRRRSRDRRAARSVDGAARRQPRVLGAAPHQHHVVRRQWHVCAALSRPGQQRVGR